MLKAGDIARWYYAKRKEWSEWFLILDKDGDSLPEEKLYHQLTVMVLEDGRIDNENWWEGAEDGHWEVA